MTPRGTVRRAPRRGRLDPVPTELAPPVTPRPVSRPGGRAVPVLVVTAALLAGCAEISDSAAREAVRSAEAAATTASAGVAAPDDAEAATVVEVLAGDTLVVEGAGGPVLTEPGPTEVRLLQLDAPEPGGTDAGGECLGDEATAFTAELLPPGSTVLVAVDEEPRDAAGRLAVYAWTEDGAFVNETVLRNGFGYALLNPPNDEHASVTGSAEGAARQARLGVWGDC